MADVVELSAENILSAAEDLLAKRRLDAALRRFQEAEARGANPDACVAGRWQIHMIRGDFAAAWEESRAVRESGKFDETCLWRGEDIRGRRVMVRCLHGLGDAVQFLRYAPQLEAMAESVVWEVPPELLQLAPHFRGVERAMTWGDEGPNTNNWDVQMEIMELPCIFQTRLADLPIATDYLWLPQKLADSVHAGMGAASVPRIGLVWAAGEWNQSRSIPPELFSQLLETQGCEFWNMQGGAAQYFTAPHKLRDT